MFRHHGGYMLTWQLPSVSETKLLWNEAILCFVSKKIWFLTNAFVCGCTWLRACECGVHGGQTEPWFPGAGVPGGAEFSHVGAGNWAWPQQEQSEHWLRHPPQHHAPWFTKSYRAYRCLIFFVSMVIQENSIWKLMTLKRNIRALLRQLIYNKLI